MMIKNSHTIDQAAITASMLCLIHCLVLPVLVTSLPILGVMAEAEWLHRLLVIVVVPLSLIAFVPPLSTPYRHLMRGLAFAGLACLLAGAFVEAFHDYEVRLTLIGSLMIGAAHGLRIYFRRHQHVPESHR